MDSPETLIAALQPLLPCSMGTLIPHPVDIENEIKKTIDALVFISSAKPGVALALALESAAREVTVYVATNGDIARRPRETPSACFVESSAVFDRCQ